MAELNDTHAPTTEASRHRLTRRLFFGLPLLAGVLAARPSVAQAGTSTSTWKMEGNSDVDDNDFLGSKNDKSLVFKTKNIERLRITNGGRVGIGTVSPANTLHVVAPSGGITGIRSDVSSTDARATGVLGQITATAPTGAASGVKGIVTANPLPDNGGQPGYGVWGVHLGYGVGVCGQVGEFGIGVLGLSEMEGGGGIGVAGRGVLAGVRGTSERGGTGVRAEAAGFGCRGIQANSDGAGSIAITAVAQDSESNATDLTMAGVWAECTQGVGVHAWGEVGAYTAGAPGLLSLGSIAVEGSGTRVGVLGVSDNLMGNNIWSLEERWGSEKLDAFLTSPPIQMFLDEEEKPGIGVLGIGDTIGVMGHGAWANGIGVAGYAASDGYNGIGIYGKSDTHPESFAGYFDGQVTVNGALRVGAHHVVVSPQALASLSGNVTLDTAGQATVSLPAGSPALTDVRYQLTAIGAAAPGLHIAQELASGSFRIAGGTAGLKVSWRIEGAR